MTKKEKKKERFYYIDRKDIVERLMMQKYDYDENTKVGDSNLKVNVKNIDKFFTTLFKNMKNCILCTSKILIEEKRGD